MKSTNYIRLIIMPVVLALMMMNCSDKNNITDFDDDDFNDGVNAGNCTFSIPDAVLPELEPNTYFQDQNVPVTDDYMNFFEVSLLAGISGNGLYGLSPVSLGTALMQIVKFSGTAPTVSDGTCTWTFQSPAGSAQGGLQLTVIGRPANNNTVEWHLKLSGDFDGNSVSDATYLKGYVSADLKTGQWGLYDPADGSQAAIIYTWDIEDAGNYSASYSSIDLNEFPVIMYQRAAPENFLTYESVDYSATLYWNEETHKGWILDELGQRCYEDFLNSEC